MALALLNMLLFFGFLTAVFGNQQHETAAVEVEKALNETRDILTVLFPGDRLSPGSKGTATSTKISEAPDDTISDGFGGVVISKLMDISGNLSGKVNSNRNDNVRLNVSGNVNGAVQNKVTGKLNEAPGYVYSNVNSNVKPKVSVNLNGTVPDNVNGEVPGSLSGKVPIKVNVNVPNKVKGKIPGEVNGNAGGDVNGKKYGKVSGAASETVTGKVDIEPYFIIDAPIRPDDEGHGCKNGQRWSFGHCRDILE